LWQFIARMRELSGGKPAGFKLCIGHPWEFMAICKAMVETGITPDFIVIDGKEGGTGAAPLGIHGPSRHADARRADLRP
jgi:glutamate synthase domain-containing protein 2